MGKQYFIQLLQKYLKGESTAEENDFLNTFYNLFENEPDVLSVLNAEKKEVLKNEIFMAIQKNIAEQEASAVKVKSIKAPIFKSAASFLASTVFTMALFIPEMSSSFNNAINTPGHNVKPVPCKSRVLAVQDNQVIKKFMS
jgi:hypothetical protein